jgi:hypothetical protein
MDHDNGWFRGFIGVLVLVGGLGALAGLYFVDIPDGNNEPLLLAIGIILGWGGSVIASEYGATTTGRKVAESAVRQIERQTIANEYPSEPQQVHVVNTPGDPVPVSEERP